MSSIRYNWGVGGSSCVSSGYTVRISDLFHSLLSHLSIGALHCVIATLIEDHQGVAEAQQQTDNAHKNACKK